MALTTGLLCVGERCICLSWATFCLLIFWRYSLFRLQRICFSLRGLPHLESFDETLETEGLHLFVVNDINAEVEKVLRILRGVGDEASHSEFQTV